MTDGGVKKSNAGSLAATRRAVESLPYTAEMTARQSTGVYWRAVNKAPLVIDSALRDFQLRRGACSVCVRARACALTPLIN